MEAAGDAEATVGALGLAGAAGDGVPTTPPPMQADTAAATTISRGRGRSDR
jgi:hypothetical protein